jgi:ATP-dependent helicase Lhr and Lhr-like helicase
LFAHRLLQAVYKIPLFWTDPVKGNIIIEDKSDKLMMVEYKEKPNTADELLTILHPLVKKWFFSRFKEFSLPQLFGVMEIHSRKNVLISAPTGATKTLTGFLSILNELVDSANKGILEDKVYCVYVSPLKALNADIGVNLLGPLKEMEALAGKELGIRIGVRTGDTTQKEKTAMLKKSPHILITTPESLAIMLNSPKFSEKLTDVQWCILDEIHALAENKRGVHMSLSLERLQNLSTHITRVGLSATVAPLEEIAKYLVGYTDGELRDCTTIDVQFIKQMDLKVISPVDNLVDTTHEKTYNALYRKMHELIQEHKTTVIFTNTRSATERVVHNMKEFYPEDYIENIGAHHSSLSKSVRKGIEDRLRNGELKVVVCSTSLELGIDIGFIDLVICLSSPKSVARFLQRAGRAGHQLHSTVKARILVSDRDDLVECSLLLKSAVEKKIDRVHIPTLCLDVLAQHIFGIAIKERMTAQDMFAMIKKSYCFGELEWKEFDGLLRYLSGDFTALEDRHVYARIWWDRETDVIGKRGKLARVIYMTNIGTIPDESFITVKIAGTTDNIVGKIDEGFLEKLKPGDIFVLGGDTYQFRYSRGMVASVIPITGRQPTVPRWFSEMLPLSFDLAQEIGKFRLLMHDKFRHGLDKKEMLEFIHDYLYVDDKAALSIYGYFWEQYHFSSIPHKGKIVIEHYDDEKRKYALFHTVYGRRVNDCLSRAVAFAIGRQQHRDVDVGINDNGFYVAYDGTVNVMKAFKILNPEQLRKILEQAIEKSEVLNRRFRHCAGRSLMILRQYKGLRKSAGRQQVSSKILMSAVKRIDENFPILKEARREVLEDLMDFEHAQEILEKVGSGEIVVEEVYTQIPSPFAFGLIVQGFSDVVRIEERYEFVKRMHQMVLAKIGMKEDFVEGV